MRDAQPGVEALLLRRLDHRLAGAQLAAFGDEGGRRRIARGQGGGDRMLRRQGDEGHAEQRIGPGGVNLDPVDPGFRGDQRKVQLRAGAVADPVLLHRAHAFRPPVHPIQRRKQVGGVFGDAEEPLRQQLLFHQRARTPAAAVDHLLVGQDRAVHRVPVHPAFLALHQSGGHEVQEQLLLLAVIWRVAGREFARPVQRQSHALQFGAHIGDVLMGPFGRMHAALACGVFRRQAERVPAHRVQHGKAARALVARHHVAQRIVANMPHVDLAAGIREHLQHIIFGLAVGRQILDMEAAVPVPFLLPARLCGPEIVTRGVWCGLVLDLSHP